MKLDPVILKLRQFMSDDEGQLKRGSIARVSGHLKISGNAVSKFLSGEYQPGIFTKVRINEMIAARIDLSPRHRNQHGPAKPKLNGKKNRPIRKKVLR